MSNSKRDKPGNFETPVASKKPKSNELRNRILENVINESVGNDTMEVSFIPTPSTSISKRVSLRPEARTSLPLSKFAAKSEESFSSSVRHEGEEEKPVIHNKLEYSNNLESLHEIMSKSFDPKRAFNYNFISIMNTFINNERGNVDFKLIGLSLEAGTKVWLSKVDVVYRNTQKVSNSLTMATDDKRQSGDENEEDVDGDALFEQTFAELKKKRKRKKKVVPSVVSNVNTINGKYETNIEVDPLFHHFSAAFDVGDVNSLLMANLTRNPLGALLLDSNETLNFTSSETTPSMAVEVSTFNTSTNLPNMICPILSIRDFAFNDRTSVSVSASSNSEPENRIPFLFDINAEVEDIDLGDDYFANDDDNENENANGPNDHCQSRVLDVSMLGANFMDILPTNDNQFFNKNFLKQVLRKMPFKKSRLLFNTTNNEQKSAQRKTRSSYVENVYNLEIHPDLFVTRESYKFTTATLNKWIANSDLFRIKDDYGFSNAWLKRCFSKPNTYFQDLLKEDEEAEREANQLANDEGHSAFDDDDRDSSNFSLNFDEPDDFELPNEKTGDEPQHVDALDIDYAKVSKKVDMKRVKKGMWDILCDTADTNSLFGNAETTNDEQHSDSCTKEVMTFSSLRQTLPNRIKTNLNENLSVPISFVALLHLCNDKDLELSAVQEDELSDFVIQMSSDIQSED